MALATKDQRLPEWISFSKSYSKFRIKCALVVGISGHICSHGDSCGFKAGHRHDIYFPMEICTFVCFFPTKTKIDIICRLKDFD